MSALLALPPEVRVHIYQYHFSDIRVTYNHLNSTKPTWSEQSCVRIFIVCKRIFNESWAVFFEQARINLYGCIDILHCSFCPSVVNPGLIRHAYLDTDLLDGSDSTTECKKLGEMIFAMPNLQSFIYRTLHADYAFQGAQMNGIFPSDRRKASLLERPGRMIGQEKAFYMERPAIRSLISAWQQRQKSFRLLSEVIIYRRRNGWEEEILVSH